MANFTTARNPSSLSVVHKLNQYLDPDGSRVRRTRPWIGKEEYATMQGHMRFDTLVIMTNTWLYGWVVEETFVALGDTPRYLPS